MQNKKLNQFYQDPPTQEKVIPINKQENLLDFNREQRQKKIKEVLIHSLELKMKLKRQLKILRDKNIVDRSVIKANLKLINLDDDNIF